MDGLEKGQIKTPETPEIKFDQLKNDLELMKERLKLKEKEWDELYQRFFQLPGEINRTERDKVGYDLYRMGDEKDRLRRNILLVENDKKIDELMKELEDYKKEQEKGDSKEDKGYRLLKEIEMLKNRLLELDMDMIQEVWDVVFKQQEIIRKLNKKIEELKEKK